MRVQHAVTQATALLILARTGDAALQRKRNPGTLMRRGQVEEKDAGKRKRPAGVPALSRVTLRGLKLAIGTLVPVRGEQPSALV